MKKITVKSMHKCDNCGKCLNESDFYEAFKWHYKCFECGFHYIHGSKTAEEQVEKFNDDTE